MRYYPTRKIDTTNIFSKLNDLHCVTKKEKIMLTQYGVFKYDKNQLMQAKLNLTEKGNMSIRKYINDFDFVITPEKWGKTEKAYKLPFVNQIIEMTTSTFILREKSSLKFIIEKNGKEINDYYFVSPENSDNHSLKEDIGSFLEKLK
jgi:hypothetical protein